MTRTVRLKDIAERTGFSVNTVSLALRDNPRIPERTRQVIRAAATALDYRPNELAKALVSRASRLVGLVLTDIGNPVLMRTAQAIELQLAERGYGTLFATSRGMLAEEMRVIDMFRSRRVDGILVYPAGRDSLDHLRALRIAGHPIVVLVGDRAEGLDCVSVDSRGGAAKAVRHLLELGHRRIGMIDTTRLHGNGDKRDGVLAALQVAGLGADTCLFVDAAGLGTADGHSAMAALMAARPPPTAVFATNDSLALGALRWCHGHGWRVPGDVAVIGFDNIEYGEYAAVPLSTVNYAADTISSLAVERLMQLVAAGEALPAPEVTLIDPDLVVRHSTVMRPKGST